MLTEKAKVMTAQDIERVLKRMSHEILERNRGLENMIIVGIQRRGVNLANRLREILAHFESTRILSGVLDITLYRDDLTLLHDQPVVHSTSIPEDVSERKILLVDDVIYTGRTIRAALDALMDLGRPSAVQLAVLVDRGHRELPIQPDYVGRTVPTSRSEVIEVRVMELDDKDEVVICEREEVKD
ncbi:MAG TPA: bifunctional pyr operon transcriptional regulator/uracil phosphoribosyltransferase PyrR [Synergistetes bacterium]|nr:bifunctional pyr operon transcriptional regulator/uracil phosphoribosyltransferase PyrR [Synergistota bacterium]